ncbi:hypothetical protein KI387_024252, partial [Taxus chinensis]
MKWMGSTLDRLALDRPRDRRDCLRVRQDWRPRSSSLSIHKGPTPQGKEAEVIIIFEEYSILPQDVKENFPFMYYMDMHPKIGHKTEQTRKEYHIIASKWLIRGKNRESSRMDDTTLHESVLVSSSSNEVCKNLYDAFDRHVDLTQEDMGNVLSTSSLQEVSLEASIKHVSVVDSNGMDSLGLSHEDNSEFSVDDHVLHGVDDFVDDIHSGPATHELSLMGVADIHNSSLVMSPIYHMAALTPGETNEKESTSIGIQSKSVGYENSTDGAFVKLEDMAKKDD